ncbi:ADP-ribose pyrophosphatase [Sphaerisporangium melleum]|uniref:ADP-ribose pyrophosphatase n=1 Tax=Sphaerisporangium melleum TaxID=321316 RepID=A0A917QUK5_9ACTN|nr:NUDIX hydrolase [Sphaerisporangium melleum]GGK69650.1 ADP-ribose pyrophosphatase [Sphaerisporangium melleum]GII69048.1 ADP-ribose pyrophosphatase [Sphaerisporangium melleum]
MTEARAHAGDLIRAAGAVVWRGDPDAPEIAVIHRPKYDDWSLPKGKLKQGEHAVTAALREVAEEVGTSVRLGRRLPSVHYLKDGRLKRVDYWAAKVVAEIARDPTDEVDRLEWLPVDRARGLLTYEWDAGLLTALTATPPDTTPLVMVRHAYAGSRQAWEGDDDLRPLDGEGEAQARAICEILYGYRPAALISSPSRRCVQTLLPYAARQAVPIRTENVLSESGFDRSLSLKVTMSLLDEGTPTALCSHGKVLPDLLGALFERRSDTGPQDPRLRKGALAVLHHTAGRVVAVDRYTT